MDRFAVGFTSQTQNETLVVWTFLSKLEKSSWIITKSTKANGCDTRLLPCMFASDTLEGPRGTTWHCCPYFVHIFFVFQVSIYSKLMTGWPVEAGVEHFEQQDLFAKKQYRFLPISETCLIRSMFIWNISFTNLIQLARNMILIVLYIPVDNMDFLHWTGYNWNCLSRIHAKLVSVYLWEMGISVLIPDHTRLT